MSRPLSRNERVAQMNKQEELIAKKRQEILEKQKTYELGQAVAAAQSGLSPKSKKKETSKPIGGGTIKTNLPPTTAADLLDPNTKLQNTFCNDGSFLTHFKKILDAVKKETIVEEIIETPKTSPNSENKSENNETPSQPESSLPTETPSQPVSLPTNTQPIAVPLVYNTTNTASIPNIPPPIIAQLSHLPPPQPQMSCNPNVSTTFFNPPPFTHHSFTTISTPPPPPPPSTPLYLIPPPEPLQLNKIPQPRELDLNAIPKPELNLDAIQIPDHQLQVFSDNNEQFLPTTLESLVELVAENGDAYEDQIRSRKNDVHPSLWFLFDPDSMMYINYRKLLASYRQGQIQNQIRQNQNRMGDENRIKSEPSDDKYDPESVIEYHEDSDDEYMKDMMGKNLNNLKRKMEIKTESDYSDDEQELDSKQQLIQQRKRKSRWGGKVESTASIIAASNPITAIVQTNFANQNKPLLSAIQRTDPALLQYARQNYGTTNLTEDDWRKCEEHFKVNLLYQDMMRKRKEIDQLAKSGKFKYEYDSDEDIRGGTWEHKLRTAEMEATQAWADALTEQSEGKHHIGDFLPPEELKKFMEKYDAKKNNRQPDLSDYKEYKLREDNIGFQMLQKLGWKEGQGLGAGGAGIIDPVNKAPQRDANQGLGAGTPSTPEDCDNEYEAYRKRMMLAYRFRPNPLNNPRRAYY